MLWAEEGERWRWKASNGGERRRQQQLEAAVDGAQQRFIATLQVARSLGNKAYCRAAPLASVLMTSRLIRFGFSCVRFRPSFAFSNLIRCVKTPAPSLLSAEHVLQIAFVLSSSETVKCQQRRQMFAALPLGPEDSESWISTRWSCFCSE